MTEDLKRRFAVNGESLVDETNISGSSPMSAGNSPFRHGSGGGGGSGGFAVQRGFALPQQRPTLASSGATALRLSVVMFVHSTLHAKTGATAGVVSWCLSRFELGLAQFLSFRMMEKPSLHAARGAGTGIDCAPVNCSICCCPQPRRTSQHRGGYRPTQRSAPR